MDRSQEHVLQEVAEKDIRFIRLWFTDVAGVLKSVSTDPGELEDAFHEGIGFDGSAVQGLTRVCESDMLLRPDASTFQMLPSVGGDDDRVARMFCDVHTPDGRQAASDPRGVLARQVARAQELGFTVMVHPEIEFYLLRQPVSVERMVPVDHAGYFDHVVRGTSNSFRRRAVRILEDMGIPVEFSHHEGGPGQNEIDLRAVDPVRAADNIMTARTIIEEVALGEDLMATFMPKPFTDHPGSGMHTHLSLFEGDENAFHAPAGRYQLSETGRRFIAGLLAHAGEIAAITNQHVNSYIEYRVPDPSANPYLALACLIAAGLDGIAKRMELAPEAEDNVWDLSDRERQVMGIHALPDSLSQAVAAMRSSELVAAALGEEVFDFVIRNKLNEWREYRRQITVQELRQFLKVH